jgi:acetyl-CoA C-acetyltransferase
MRKDKPIYIVDGARTPFLKARGKPGPFSASDLAVLAGRDLLSRQSFSPEEIGEVIVGSVMPSEDEANIGRLIGLRLGCGEHVPGWTVQRNCGSGMQAIDSAIKDIILGRHDLVLVGGTEAMSRAPLILKPEMAAWLADLNASKNIATKLSTFTQLRPSYLSPIIALIRGLRDPLYGLNMGQTAEILAHRFNISREEMDAFAVQSHHRLAKAQDEKQLSEVVTVYDSTGHFYDDDNGVRRDSSVEKLAKLKPFFDKRFGKVTAANSSQITDGAAMLLLASEDAVKRYNLPTMGRIVDVQWAALSPEVMGLGPVMAATPLLQRNKLSLSDVDYWEINEAFSAQVLACVKAWESDAFCREHLGLDAAFGSLDQERLNVDGGAVALGHPVGASGARIVLHLLHVLKHKNTKRGVAAICIGGGQGGAMLLELND